MTERLSNLPSAILWASGCPIWKPECARFLLQAAQLEVPGAVTHHLSTFGIGGFNPLTPGRKPSADSKEEERGRGRERDGVLQGAGLSAEKTSLSRSHTLPRSVG